ncbi:hypothetical protein MBLNU230_g4995t1 [Neophaeotheca triangularis]
MRKTNRSAPRVIGSGEDEPASAPGGSGEASDSVAARPAFKPRKKKLNARTSFGLGGNDGDDEDDSSQSSGVITPKRTNAKPSTKRSSLLSTTLARRPSPEPQAKPDYSVAALRQLQSNNNPTEAHEDNPNTSQIPSAMDQVAETTQSLDLSSKFGTDMSRYSQPSAIPTSAEIAEKKARRARLAKQEQADEYISLDPEQLDDYAGEDDENTTVDASGRLVLKPAGDKYGMSESRLTKDDEDIMEGFAEMEDGRLALGDRAEKAAERARKSEMARMIADAEEGDGDEEEDDSERERMDAFDAAQTRHATGKGEPGAAGLQAPPKIAPLPTLDGALERLRRQMEGIQMDRERQLMEVEALKKERAQIAKEEERIQQALRDTAAYYEKLRAEKGIEQAGNALATSTNGAPSLAIGAQQQTEQSGESGESDDGDEREETPRMGLGMAGRGRAAGEFGSTAGLGAAPAPGETVD